MRNYFRQGTKLQEYWKYFKVRGHSTEQLIARTLFANKSLKWESRAPLRNLLYLIFIVPYRDI